MLKNCLYGINVNEGPLLFASSVIKEKFNYVTHEIIQGSEILDGILYHVCNVAASQEDIVKARINDRSLELELREQFNQNSSIWSSFLVVNNTERRFYRGSCVVKFNNEDGGNTQQCTSDIIGFARSSESEIPFISKLVPTVGKLGYTVSVISCESESCEKIDQFEILPVKYIGHHPLFDFGHSIFKSLEETQSILGLADCHLNMPETEKLKSKADACSRKTFQFKDAYPFIVVEGLDGVGKSVQQRNI